MGVHQARHDDERPQVEALLGDRPAGARATADGPMRPAASTSMSPSGLQRVPPPASGVSRRARRLKGGRSGNVTAIARMLHAPRCAGPAAQCAGGHDFDRLLTPASRPAPVRPGRRGGVRPPIAPSPTWPATRAGPRRTRSSEPRDDRLAGRAPPGRARRVVPGRARRARGAPTSSSAIAASRPRADEPLARRPRVPRWVRPRRAAATPRRPSASCCGTCSRTAAKHKVCADCDTRNDPSWRLLERLGFTREGHAPRRLPIGDPGPTSTCTGCSPPSGANGLQ